MRAVRLEELLKSHSYPGRGIALGRSDDGGKAVIVYFIMGRSENSRNRVFEQTPDGIRTKAFDEEKMRDPSLVIYHPVRTLRGETIVTNGDQTDTIRDALSVGTGDFRSALMSRSFEPDEPIYTPRISGLLHEDGSYEMSILKTLNGDPSHTCRFFYTYDQPPAGMGHFIYTYQENRPTPLSFEGEPRLIHIEGNAQALASSIWSALNESNKVSLFVQQLSLAAGERETVILNKNL